MRVGPAAALSLLAAGCGGGEPEGVSRPADGLGAACADCHGHLVEAWRTTAMARALGPLVPGELQGLGEVQDPGSPFAYRYQEEGGRPLLVETAAGGHALSAPVAFAVGAGVLDRSYAVVQGRTLWFAPLEVLAARGARPRRAALAPGNAIAPGSRASVPITPECLGCHTDAPPPASWPLNLLPEGWTPRGISCAACHGGSAEHAAWRAAELGGEAPAGADPLLDLAALGRFEQLSLCAACHLQGDARIVLDPDELGPPPPGGDLLARRALFVARTPTDDVGFVSQVERLLLSACFLGSEMTCTTCHDPHRPLSDPAERARTRDACAGCHGDLPPEHGAPAPGEAARDCAGCHMRRTPVFDVAEVEIHDHWIRAQPGPPSTPAPLRTQESPEGHWKRVQWPGAPAPEHLHDAGLLMMALAHRGHEDRARELLDVPPGPGARDLPMYHHVRAGLLEATGRPADARAAYERALALDPDLAASATNLALLEAAAGEPDAALARLDRVLAAHPSADGALRNRAVLRQRRGDSAGAVRDLEAAHAVRPDAALAGALAELYGAAGDGERAEDWRRVARELDPRR
jgi:predicted CXXCH cytochrome family protein